MSRTGLDPKIDPMLAGNPSANMYLAFSKDILLQAYVLPALPGVFQKATNQNTTAASFQFDAANHAITGSKIVLLQFNDVRQFNDILPVTLTEFNLSVQDNLLMSTMSGSFFDMPAFVSYSASYHTPVTFVAASSAFVTQADPNPGKNIETGPNVTDPGGLAIQGVISESVKSFFDAFVTAFNLSMQFQIPVHWNGVGNGFQVVQAALNTNVFLQGKSGS